MPIVLGLVIDHGVLAGDLRLTVLGALGLIALRVLGVALWTYTFIESQKACMLERHRLRVGLTGAVLDPRSRAVRRPAGEVLSIDRKSTRLNSSHVAISYAVFCVKKKNQRVHSTI